MTKRIGNQVSGWELGSYATSAYDVGVKGRQTENGHGKLAHLQWGSSRTFRSCDYRDQPRDHRDLRSWVPRAHPDFRFPVGHLLLDTSLGFWNVTLKVVCHFLAEPNGLLGANLCNSKRHCLQNDIDKKIKSFQGFYCHQQSLAACWTVSGLLGNSV